MKQRAKKPLRPIPVFRSDSETFRISRCSRCISRIVSRRSAAHRGCVAVRARVPRVAAAAVPGGITNCARPQWRPCFIHRSRDHRADPSRQGA